MMPEMKMMRMNNNRIKMDCKKRRNKMKVNKYRTSMMIFMKIRKLDSIT